MKRIYRAALIGCGKMGLEEKRYAKEIYPVTHAAAYDSHPRAKLCALADISQERLAVAKSYYPKLPLYTSAKELLRKEKPDIVSIATQPDTHAMLTALAAQYKTKAIVCEKPIAYSLLEGRAMIDACKKNGSLLFINHGRRFDPLIGAWAKKVRAGIIGDVMQGNGFYYNGLFNNATHTIDLLRFFLGEITAVQGWTNQKTTSLENDNNIDAFLHFKNGARVALQTLPKNYGFAPLYFYGTKGRVALKALGATIEYTKLVDNTTWKGYYQLSSHAQTMGKVRGFTKSMVTHVVHCLDKKEIPLSAGEDGLAALGVLLAIQESAKSNEKLINLHDLRS